MSDRDFKLGVFCDVFEKGSGPNRYRIGGVITTDTLDRQSERVIQDGLEFKEFLQHGWLNDNHKPDADAVVGYPETVRKVKKGETLPNGTKARANGHYMEGWLLDVGAGKTYIDLAKGLKGTGRKIGFSIQGKILERGGTDGKTVRKASVNHCAVTHVPVNTDTELELLAKALSMGTGTGPVQGAPVTGEGAGQVVTPESLEHDEKNAEKRTMKKAEGEGSRGGKVVGHTASGKPIYESDIHARAKKMSAGYKHKPGMEPHVDHHIKVTKDRESKLQGEGNWDGSGEAMRSRKNLESHKKYIGMRVRSGGSTGVVHDVHPSGLTGAALSVHWDDGTAGGNYRPSDLDGEKPDRYGRHHDLTQHVKKGLTLRETIYYLRGKGLENPKHIAAVIAYTEARKAGEIQ